MPEMDEEDSHNLRQMAKGGGILILGAFATKAIMYFYRILVAQELGADIYGVLSQGLALFWIVMVLSNLGVGAGIQRKVSDYLGKEENERLHGILWAALSMSMPLAILAAVIAFISAEFIANTVFQDTRLVFVFKVFAIAVPFQMLYKNFASVAKAFREMKYITYVDKIYRSLATFGLTALLILLGYEIEAVVFGQFIAIATSSLLMAYFVQKNVFSYFRSFLKRRFVWEGKERKELISYSWPVFLSSAVALSTSWADTLILGIFENSGTVGVYNAALPTAQILLLFGVQMSNVLFPTVSEYYGKGRKEKSVKLASTALKWIFFFTFPGMIMMFIFPKQILGLLFGESFTGAAFALSVLAVAYFIQTMTSHNGSFIKSEDRTKLQLINAGLISVVNVILNFLLIPIYGIGGAALATAFSISTVNILAMLEVRLLFDVQPYRLSKFIPATAATLISASFVYVALRSVFETVPKLVLIPGLAVFGGLYITLYILLGGVSEQDKEIVKSVEEKVNLPLTKYLKKIEDISIV